MQSLQGYTVSRRDASGAATEIRCAVHEACAWAMKASGRRDDDPIFVAQFQNHLRQALEPDVKALGHMRRERH